MGSNRRKVMKSIPQIDQQGSTPRDAPKYTSEAEMKHQVLEEPLNS